MQLLQLHSLAPTPEELEERISFIVSYIKTNPISNSQVHLPELSIKFDRETLSTLSVIMNWLVTANAEQQPVRVYIEVMVCNVGVC